MNIVIIMTSEEFKMFASQGNFTALRIDSQWSGTMWSGQVYTMILEVTTALNSSKKCVAFDTVSHKKLLEALPRYGIRSIVLKLFKNYLLERYQLEKINNVLSEKQEIKMKVPQGTVLGPVLFLIYLNSILNLNVNGVVVSYADDTVLIFMEDN